MNFLKKATHAFILTCLGSCSPLHYGLSGTEPNTFIGSYLVCVLTTD